MLSYLLYFLTLLGVYILTPSYTFFLRMITMDSVLSAIYYMTTFINSNLSEKEIVTISGELYNGSALDRYIYYGLTALLYYICKIVLWTPNANIIYFGLVASIMPPILNRICDTSIFQKIRNVKEEIVKIIIAQQFANAITMISKVYLQEDVKIKHKELLPLFTNYGSTISYFWEGLKNTLIILLVSYIKSCSPGFYYRVTKYFVGYQTGDMLVSFTNASAKKVLSDVIKNKRWDEFLKPNTFIKTAMKKQPILKI